MPAVLAYNYFVRGLKVQVSDLEQFGSSFIGAAAKEPRQSKLRVERAASLERREASV